MCRKEKFAKILFRKIKENSINGPIWIRIKKIFIFFICVYFPSFFLLSKYFLLILNSSQLSAHSLMLLTMQRTIQRDNILLRPSNIVPFLDKIKLRKFNILTISSVKKKYISISKSIKCSTLCRLYVAPCTTQR